MPDSVPGDPGAASQAGRRRVHRRSVASTLLVPPGRAALDTPASTSSTKIDGFDLSGPAGSSHHPPGCSPRPVPIRFHRRSRPPGVGGGQAAGERGGTVGSRPRRYTDPAPRAACSGGRRPPPGFSRPSGADQPVATHPCNRVPDGTRRRMDTPEFLANRAFFPGYPPAWFFDPPAGRRSRTSATMASGSSESGRRTGDSGGRASQPPPGRRGGSGRRSAAGRRPRARRSDRPIATGFRPTAGARRGADETGSSSTTTAGGRSRGNNRPRSRGPDGSPPPRPRR